MSEASDTARLDITPVNDPPTASGLTRDLRLDENAAATSLFAAAPTLGDVDGPGLSVRLTLSVPAAGALIGAGTGSNGTYVLTGTIAEVQARLAAVAFEPAADFEGQVDVAVVVGDGSLDPGAANPSGTVTIRVEAVNEAPVITSGATGSVAENADPATVVYAASATDHDAGDTVSWSLAGTDAAAFTIDASGAVRLKQAADFEAKASYAIEVVASDRGGLRDAEAVTIGVVDLNDVAPVVTSGERAGVAENVAPTVAVYTAQARDGDGTAPNAHLVYSLASGGDNDLFAIDAVTGAVRFKASPDHEAPADADRDNVYDITVVATDGGAPALSARQAVAVTVTDLDDAAPVAGPVTLAAMAEDTGPRIITAAELLAGVTDADTAPTGLAITTLRLSGGHGSLVANPDGTWSYTPAPDDDASASFRYTVSDGARTAEASASLDITPVNDAPTLESGFTGRINEGEAASRYVWTARAHDRDPGDSLTWSLDGADASLFEIGADGTLRLKGPADLESKPGYAVTVVATDGSGARASEAVRLDVVDLDEAPTVAPIEPVRFAENTATGTVLFTASATDPDTSQPFNALRWSLAGEDADAFAIDAGGRVSLARAADFEAKPGYAITVVATDGGGLSHGRDVAVAVTDVDERPTVTLGQGAAAYTEDGPGIVVAAVDLASVGGTTLSGATVRISDGFAPGQDVLALDGSGSLAVRYDGATGTLHLTGTASLTVYQEALSRVTFASAGDDPSTAERTIAFTVADGPNASLAATKRVTVEAVDDAPTVDAPVALTVREETRRPLTGIDFSDPDTDDGTIVATFHVDAGSLEGQDIDGILVGGTASELTLTGSVSAINAYIEDGCLSFLTTDENDEIRLTTSVRDAGASGSAGADGRTTKIQVEPVNDAPEIVLGELPGGIYLEGDNPLVVDGGIVLRDVDSKSLAYATAEIKTGYGSGDMLIFTETDVIRGHYADGVLTLEGEASIEQYQDALASVSFWSENPSASGDRTIAFTVSDGTDVSASASKIIGIHDDPMTA